MSKSPFLFSRYSLQYNYVSCQRTQPNYINYLPEWKKISFFMWITIYFLIISTLLTKCNVCLYCCLPFTLNTVERYSMPKKTLRSCLLYTNICTKKHCKFILNYSDMFRYSYTIFMEFTGRVSYGVYRSC